MHVCVIPCFFLQHIRAALPLEYYSCELQWYILEDEGEKRTMREREKQYDLSGNDTHDIALREMRSSTIPAELPRLVRVIGENRSVQMTCVVWVPLDCDYLDLTTR